MGSQQERGRCPNGDHIIDNIKSALIQIRLAERCMTNEKAILGFRNAGICMLTVAAMLQKGLSVQGTAYRGICIKFAGRCSAEGVLACMTWGPLIRLTERGVV
jgi:hypothetical protein